MILRNATIKHHDCIRAYIFASAVGSTGALQHTRAISCIFLKGSGTPKLTFSYLKLYLFGIPEI